MLKVLETKAGCFIQRNLTISNLLKSSGTARLARVSSTKFVFTLRFLVSEGFGSFQDQRAKMQSWLCYFEVMWTWARHLSSFLDMYVWISM